MNPSATIKILVTGDFARDYNIYLPSHDCHLGTGVQRSRFNCLLGGAAIIHGILNEVATQLPDTEPCSMQVGFAAKTDQYKPTGQPAAGFWVPQNGGHLFDSKKIQLWRLTKSFGLGEAIGFPDLKAMNELPISGEDFQPDILVVEDDAGKFRFKLPPSHWPAVLEKEGELPKWIVMKMTSPLCQGDLWWHLVRDGGPADRLVVVLPVGDLRKEDVRVSQDISWERTAEDLVRELEESPILAGLKRARYVVVVLNGEGAVLVDRDANKQEKYLLIFDPQHMEQEWADGAEIKGDAYGFMSSFTAAIAARMALSKDWQSDPDIKGGTENGLRIARLLRLLGHGNTKADKPGFPFREMARCIVQDKFQDTSVYDGQMVDFKNLGSFGRAVIPAGSSNQAALPGECSARPEFVRSWRILEGVKTAATPQQGEPLYGVARRVALFGLKELQHAPFARFGELLTTDRDEIEALRNIKRLIQDYRDSADLQKPLSLAVFGPPGAGKSFAIKQIAKGVLGDKAPTLEFNLSQFDNTSYLIGAFHQVRDKVLEGHIPLVFWDEFDSRSYEWLQYLLAPMQDGKFQEDQITHPIGRCIFVFAGAISYDMQNFGPQQEKDSNAYEKFKLLKGPDFKSRLHGFLNVLGPNRRQICQWKERPDGSFYPIWTDDPKDVCFPVRRALLLRAKLGSVKDRANQRLDIDHGLLAALLEVDRYTHGARSMEKIVQSLCQEADCCLHRSGLPTDEVLRMNTDPEEFMRIAKVNQDFQGQAQLLAPAIHEYYLQLCRKNGWSIDYDMPYKELPESIKMDNIAAAHRIPWVLSLAGLYLVEGEFESEKEQDEVNGIINTHLETLAMEEHDLWWTFKVKNGWKPGKPKDNKLKIHPCLMQFHELEEKDRAKDRDAVQNYPEIAKRAGFKIVAQKPAQSYSIQSANNI